MAIRIITDSTSDFTRAEAAQLGLEIVPLKTRFGDEEYIDGVTISPKEFYEKLIEGDVLPTTSQPSPSEFEEVYDRVLGPEDEAVVITISAELSGTCQSALIAAEKYEGRVHVVDSRSAIWASGRWLGQPAIRAAMMAVRILVQGSMVTQSVP